MAFWIILWIVFGVVGAIVAGNKGRSVAGWAALGFLFPPALLILLALERIEDAAADASSPRYLPATAGPNPRDGVRPVQSAQRSLIMLHHADRGTAFELSVEDIESVSEGGDGTIVWCGDRGYKVTETPSEIGLLIDRALGVR